jgi:hypothetical protein
MSVIVKVFLMTIVVSVCFSCARDNFFRKNDPLSDYEKNYFSSYKDIYNAANDSLQFWITDSLKIVGFEFFNPFKLDSSLCFNNDSTRFFSTVLNQELGYKNSGVDQIREFGGAKINDKWYFFFIASTMVVPREFYKEDVYEPLTFEELSAISHREIMKNALIKMPDGSFKPNDEFFELVFNDQRLPANKGRTIQDHDSSILKNVKEKYKYKLNPEEIIEIKEEMARSVRPPAKWKWWKFW